MLASALGALSDRLDSKFLIAYWLPAFVATLGGFGLLAFLAGAEQIDAWIYGLDSVEQTLAVLLIVLTVTMGAFVLRALSRPVSEVFAGEALPRGVADWSTRGQLRGKRRAARILSGDGGLKAIASAGKVENAASEQEVRQSLSRVYPLDDDEVRPTRYGNVLATAVEYPRLTYMMEGLLWWPRLSPLVPIEFQDMLGGAQAPMMALLNLSVVFAALALVGAAVLVLAGGHWVAAIVVLVGGLLLARLCYRAGVSQAAELASLLRVGFDLYRHEILRQMDLDVPADIAAERQLWLQLTSEMLGLPPQEQPPADNADAT